MSVLDELDRAERAMTPGPWEENRAYDGAGIALLRNHARALIDVARAARDLLGLAKTVYAAIGITPEPERQVMDRARAALARLEADDEAR